MLEAHSVLRALLKKCVVFSLAAISLLVTGSAWADGNDKDKNNGPVNLLKTIPIPPTAANVGQNFYSYDISFVDQKTQTYYLADRSNVVVDVIDASQAGNSTYAPAQAQQTITVTAPSQSNSIDGTGGPPS